MRNLFRDKEHLVRMVGLFIAGGLVFLVMRALLVPSDFGEFGHFRAGALDDNRSVPIRHAGRALCVECHDEVAEQRSGSKHAGIGCESCHGALAVHAEDPGSLQPELPRAAELCVKCHTRNVARPDWFPQIDVEEHADGEACDECHIAHHPEIE